MKRFLFAAVAVALFLRSDGLRAQPKAEEIGTISGITINRPNGTYLGIELVNENFKLTFYNNKKKPMQHDFDRAALRWPVHYQPNEERTVLEAGGDGTFLTSPKNVRPPHEFKLFIALFADGNQDAGETYSIDFHN